VLKQLEVQAAVLALARLMSVLDARATAAGAMASGAMAAVVVISAVVGAAAAVVALVLEVAAAPEARRASSVVKLATGLETARRQLLAAVSQGGAVALPPEALARVAEAAAASNAAAADTGRGTARTRQLPTSLFVSNAQSSSLRLGCANGVCSNAQPRCWCRLAPQIRFRSLLSHRSQHSRSHLVQLDPSDQPNHPVDVVFDA